ncbi:DUF1801 domain-containing protein [Aequorivita sp. CIP111184]|uniref:DUF1801 domain-containing protein n=1 Tax=Aequorivita sp. CIP111184 TaxID=2211356 RepID=UPI000DBC0FFA|nr:DUF1801 domain-containing protein [Aequorivita sp. CIP111184]SRX53049.1 hypothetical protein AEQU1_00830 [Aequorivita sp. CIP111184]
MKLTSDPKVAAVFENYPKGVKQKMLQLRELVLCTASETEGLEKLEETLKWGEPSFLTKFGSTVRMDWKEKAPDQVAVYFKCTSQLVPTFREVYKNKFNFEGNRAIVFKLNERIPETELKHCFTMALNYHKIKNLPLLGA